jgi:hypothetical protein
MPLRTIFALAHCRGAAAVEDVLLVVVTFDVDVDLAVVVAFDVVAACVGLFCFLFVDGRISIFAHFLGYTASTLD